MENFLRTRVQARLDALGLNPFEAARRAGGERTFLNDILIGKKDTIRRAAIPRVADALDCDPEYLLGAQDVPRRAPSPSPGNPGNKPEKAPQGIRLVGIAEAGTWRLAGRSGASPALPIAPDPRHPAEVQVAYLVRGDHAAGLGATDGAVVVGVTGAQDRDAMCWSSGASAIWAKGARRKSRSGAQMAHGWNAKMLMGRSLVSTGKPQKSLRAQSLLIRFSNLKITS